MKGLDRDLLDSIGLSPVGEKSGDASEEEVKELQANASVVFNNPLFQRAMKQAHASCFQGLMDAIRKNDQHESVKQLAAMDTISTIYEHFRIVSDEDANSLNAFDLNYGD